MLPKYGGQKFSHSLPLLQRGAYTEGTIMPDWYVQQQAAYLTQHKPSQVTSSLGRPAPCCRQPLLQQMLDALHHCSPPEKPTPQSMGQTLCSCGPFSPRLLLVTEQAQCIGCLKLKQVQFVEEQG